MGAESSPSWTPQIHGNPMEGLLINMAGVGKTQCHKPSPKELLIINMAARVAHIVPQYPQIFPLKLPSVGDFPTFFWGMRIPNEAAG